jgi:hypothetical protein
VSRRRRRRRKIAKTRGSSFDYVNSLIGSVSLQVLPRR